MQIYDKEDLEELEQAIELSDEIEEKYLGNKTMGIKKLVLALLIQKYASNIKVHTNDFMEDIGGALCFINDEEALFASVIHHGMYETK